MTIQTLNVTGIDLDFRKLADTLRRFRPVTFDEMLESFKGVAAIKEVRRVAHALKLDQDERLKTLACLWDKGEYVSTVIGLLARIIPIWEDQMISSILDEGNLEILPEALGMNRFYGDDSWECFNDPGAYFYPDNAVEVFIAALDRDIDDESWAICNEYFGWNVPEMPSIPYGSVFSLRSMKRKLRAADMEVFIGAMDVAIGIDNIFFCCDIFNDPDVIEFNIREVRRLMREAKSARLKHINLEMAEQMAKEDNTLFQKYLNIWVSSFKPAIKEYSERDLA